MGEIMTCKMCCLLCSNSFSEPEAKEDTGNDILHCMAKDGEIVNPMDYCDEYN